MINMIHDVVHVAKRLTSAAPDTRPFRRWPSDGVADTRASPKALPSPKMAWFPAASDASASTPSTTSRWPGLAAMAQIKMGAVEEHQVPAQPTSRRVQEEGTER